MPRLRAQRGRPITSRVMPDPDCLKADADPWRGIDPKDPAIGYITRELVHLASAYGFDPCDETIIAGAIRHGRELHEADRARWLKTFEVSPPVNGSVVYYMRMGNRCKIGFSTNIAARLEAINPEELLITEPGGAAQETARHAQFRDLRTHGEWFRYEGALVEHVARLRGEPPPLAPEEIVRLLRVSMTPMERYMLRPLGG